MKTFKLCEQAYFEGQKDYAKGDVRIGVGADSVYYWVRSPWDDGTPPKFIPSYTDSKE